MRKVFATLLIGTCFFLAACNESSETQKLYFATCADYPPFEYNINGGLAGFDIELAKMIAKELGKEAVFQNMQFSAALVAVQTGMVDAAISTITITENRRKNFDFSEPYHVEQMAVVFPKNKPINQTSELFDKKIACQLGTTMEIWLKKHTSNTEIITTDSNPQAIEALKAGHVDGVLIDSAQGAIFSQKNPQLAHKIIAQADTGYGIVFKKGSPLKDQFNKALESLEERGLIQQLKEKYLEGNRWEN